MESEPQPPPTTGADAGAGAAGAGADAGAAGAGAAGAAAAEEAMAAAASSSSFGVRMCAYVCGWIRGWWDWKGWVWGDDGLWRRVCGVCGVCGSLVPSDVYVHVYTYMRVTYSTIPPFTHHIYIYTYT